MTSPLVYFRDRFIPQDQACLTLHDAGFVMGATITDLCRTYRHRLVRLREHLARFRRGCTLADVPLLLSDDELADRAEELVRHNAALLAPDDDLALVFLATPGPIGYYLGEPGGPGEGPPTLVLHTFPLPLYRYRSLFTEGGHLVVPAVRHVPPASVDPRIKQRSRLHWWLASRQAQARDPGAQPLLLDAEGYVTETAGANFLIVRDGMVLSPASEQVLDGMSLRLVRELCAEADLPFREQRLSLPDCLVADEALLTSTPFGVVGVSRLQGQALPWPGPVLQHLLQSWSERVGVDVRAQILGK